MPSSSALQIERNVIVIDSKLMFFWFLPIVVVLGYLYYHLGMGDVVIILAAVLTVVSLLLWIVATFPAQARNEGGQSFVGKLWSLVKNGGRQPAEAETDYVFQSQDDWTKVMAHFKASMRDAASSLKLLMMFRKRLSKNDKFALESAQNGLFKYATLCLSTVAAEDARIPVALDVINALLASPSSKAFLLTNAESVDAVHDNIDVCLSAADMLYGKYIDAANQGQEMEEVDIDTFDETGTSFISYLSCH
jgi:hypothetical protein